MVCQRIVHFIGRPSLVMAAWTTTGRMALWLCPGSEEQPNGTCQEYCIGELKYTYKIYGPPPLRLVPSIHVIKALSVSLSKSLITADWEWSRDIAVRGSSETDLSFGIDLQSSDVILSIPIFRITFRTDFQDTFSHLVSKTAFSVSGHLDGTQQDALLLHPFLRCINWAAEKWVDHTRKKR